MKVTQYCTQCGLKVIKRANNLYKCTDGHENWLNPTPGAVAFILKDEKVLYGVRGIEPSIGCLSLPGGFVELNESLEEAVLREVKEELDIDIKIIDFLGSYPHEYGIGKPSLPVVFVAEYVGGIIKPNDDLNGGSPEWRGLDNLPNNDEVTCLGMKKPILCSLNVDFNPRVRHPGRDEPVVRRRGYVPL